MPYRPLKPCRCQGCSRLTSGEFCDKHIGLYIKRKYNIRERDDRPSASQRGYDKQWQRARKMFLAGHPLCAECERQGRLTEATVVDHIIPHKGDRKLFWDTDNWQSLCKRCHDIKTVREDGGFGHAVRDR